MKMSFNFFFVIIESKGRIFPVSLLDTHTDTHRQIHT